MKLAASLAVDEQTKTIKYLKISKQFYKIRKSLIMERNFIKI